MIIDDTTPDPDRLHGDPSTGELQLEERSSLRRVVGLSTELQDINDAEYRQLRLERVVLVGVWTEGSAAQAEAAKTMKPQRKASLSQRAGLVVAFMVFPCSSNKSSAGPAGPDRGLSRKPEAARRGPGEAQNVRSEQSHGYSSRFIIHVSGWGW